MIIDLAAAHRPALWPACQRNCLKQRCCFFNLLCLSLGRTLGRLYVNSPFSLISSLNLTDRQK